jgi:hypothetical protein
LTNLLVEYFDGAGAKKDIIGVLSRERGIAASVSETQGEVWDPMMPTVVCRRCKGGNIMAAEMMEMRLLFLVCRAG